MIFFEQQKELNYNFLEDIRRIVNLINDTNYQINQSLNQQTETISFQLEKAAQSLENRIKSLEKCTANISALVDLEKKLDQSLQNLEKTAQLEHVLTKVEVKLAELKPVLEQLNKPRKITLIETEERGF
jgi:DNA repair ATPase RecN